ncbi:MAG: S1 family peptidase [Myxococcales bacterium]|nr:S1 family peptidase [Myxococcales bacterium]
MRVIISVGMGAARLLGIAGLIACSSPPPYATHDVAPITQGAVNDGDPAVVGIVIGGTIACTGLVVHPRIVLTAAHCIAPTAPSAVLVGSSAATGLAITVMRARRHPHAALDSVGADLAYLVLTRDAAVMPVAIGSLASADVGADVRVVGFGRATPDDVTAGTKREGISRLDALAERMLSLTPHPSLPCRGDSGGPVFLGERVVGLVSEGDSACMGESRAVRLDANTAFLGPVLTQIAEVERGLGVGCVVDENCTSHACVALDEAPAFPLCSAMCIEDYDCPAPLRCHSSGSARWCAPNGIPGALGSPCADEFACDSGCAKTAWMATASAPRSASRLIRQRALLASSAGHLRRQGLGPTANSSAIASPNEGTGGRERVFGRRRPRIERRVDCGRRIFSTGCVAKAEAQELLLRLQKLNQSSWCSSHPAPRTRRGGRGGVKGMTFAST